MLFMVYIYDDNTQADLGSVSFKSLYNYKINNIIYEYQIH